MEREKRYVAVCLIGVGHDEQESELRAELTQSHEPGELVFWEHYTRQNRDDPVTGHLGLEDEFAGGMQLLFSALAALLLSITDERILGHGEVQAHFRRHLQRDAPESLARYEALSTTARIVVAMGSYFMYELLDTILSSGGHGAARAYFNGDEEVGDAFVELMEEALGGDLEFADCCLRLTEYTLPVLTRLLVGFRDLLVRYAARLSEKLRRIASVARALRDAPIGSKRARTDTQYARDILEAAAEIRDELNWIHVAEVVDRMPDVHRIVVVVGTQHLVLLPRLLMRANAKHTRFGAPTIIHATGLSPSIALHAARVQLRAWRQRFQRQQYY